jgi:hypothetical protein
MFTSCLCRKTKPVPEKFMFFRRALAASRPTVLDRQGQEIIKKYSV